MASYYLKLALNNFKRAPFLYFLVTLTLAIGVGLLSANLALVKSMAGNPIPEKSDSLFHISMNTWPSENPHDEPLYILRYRDTQAILESDIPSNKAVFYVTAGYVRDAESESLKRTSATIRATTSGFFSIFDTPFTYGQGFNSNSGTELVIGHQLNQTLFGGRNSVGKTLELQGTVFTIVGVLAPWQPKPLFYHATDNKEFDLPEDLFVPIETAIDNNWSALARSSSTERWREMVDTRERSVYYLQSWVELKTPAKKAAFQNYLDNYSKSLKDAGEHPLAIRNELHNVSEWLESLDVVDEKLLAFTIATGLFLFVCVFKASSLLLSKFHAAKFEIGLRRALGASKQQMFWQGLIESTLLGAIASLLSLALSWLFLKLSTEMLPALRNLAVLDMKVVMVGILLAIVTSNLSALYSLYRANRYTISAELK
jgi:putative ABC transport system permease protein